MMDLPGEAWRDITGYDGLYEISSRGRIKSLARYNALGRWREGRIMRQKRAIHNGAASVTLTTDRIRNEFTVMQLVGLAFLKPLVGEQVYFHRNMNADDNRKQNIVIGTASQAAKVRCELGGAPDNNFEAYRNSRQAAITETLRVFDGPDLVAKICQSCLVEQPLTEFRAAPNGHDGYRHSCRTCDCKHQGVQAIGKLKQAATLALAGLRTCGDCRQVKRLDTEFGVKTQNALGRHNQCKACRSKARAGTKSR